jgi:hypothetical protein
MMLLCQNQTWRGVLVSILPFTSYRRLFTPFQPPPLFEASDSEKILHLDPKHFFSFEKWC